MQSSNINDLRHFSRKLIRELGMLELSKDSTLDAPAHWHALIEISQNPKITISKLAQLLVMHISTVSRIVNSLLEDKLVKFSSDSDQRKKCLEITKKGQNEKKKIDEFSDFKVLNAFRYLGVKDQEQIIESIKKYADALEKSRLKNQLAKVKILTMSTSRALRRQIKEMIQTVQQKEFGIPYLPEDEIYILQAEKDFYYNNSYNFWYAADEAGRVIGSIALKRINKQDGEVKKFFVAREYRGQKVAQALMLKLVTAAKNHKFTHLYLGTVDILKGAQNFYEKSGFQKIDKKLLPKNYYQCSVDNLFYRGKPGEVLEKIQNYN